MTANIEVEGFFRENKSLDKTLRQAMRRDGCGLFERIIVGSKVRRMSSDARKMLEEELADMVTASAEAGDLKLPVGAIVGGVYVMGWEDLFQWFLDNLPAILDAIMMIIALFG